MNSKQFFNTGICLILDKMQWVKKIGTFFCEYVFPNATQLPISSALGENSSKKQLASIYFLVFVVLFLVQAIWAITNGRFLGDSDPLSKNFMEDWENLLDYLIICEAYCIFGFLFLKSSYQITTKLQQSGLTDYCPVEKNKNPIKSIFGVALILLAGLIGSVGYATEVQKYSSKYWFMAGDSNLFFFDKAELYYFFVNFLLLLFVSWVFVAHGSLFIIASKVGKSLIKIEEQDGIDAEIWLDENKLKAMFRPIATQVLWSKLFVLFLALNLFSWRKYEVNVGVMYKLSTPLLAIFGIWIFALPRYQIQYRIFKIWRKLGVHSYHDLRTPWIKGASSIADWILITILVKALLGEQLSSIFDKLLS